MGGHASPHSYGYLLLKWLILIDIHLIEII